MMFKVLKKDEGQEDYCSEVFRSNRVKWDTVGNLISMDKLTQISAEKAQIFFNLKDEEMSYPRYLKVPCS
jgi:hypothetical protein